MDKGVFCSSTSPSSSSSLLGFWELLSTLFGGAGFVLPVTPFFVAGFASADFDVEDEEEGGAPSDIGLGWRDEGFLN